MHIAILPLPIILPAIRPGVDAFSVEYVVQPFSFVYRSIIPHIFPIPVLYAIFVTTVILTAIRPWFNTLAVLQVVDPISLVLRSVVMSICPLPISFVILPLPIINVSIRVPKFSLGVHLVFLPFSFVLVIVWPYLKSRAVFRTCHCLAIFEVQGRVSYHWE